MKCARILLFIYSENFFSLSWKKGEEVLFGPFSCLPGNENTEVHLILCIQWISKKIEVILQYKYWP